MVDDVWSLTAQVRKWFTRQKSVLHVEVGTIAKWSLRVLHLAGTRPVFPPAGLINRFKAKGGLHIALLAVQRGTSFGAFSPSCLVRFFVRPATDDSFLCAESVIKRCFMYY